MLESIAANAVDTLFNKDTIDLICKEVKNLHEEASNNKEKISSIKRRIAEHKKATDNLYKALEKGLESDIVFDRIKEHTTKQKELEVELAKQRRCTRN